MYGFGLAPLFLLTDYAFLQITVQAFARWTSTTNQIASHKQSTFVENCDGNVNMPRIRLYFWH